MAWAGQTPAPAQAQPAAPAEAPADAAAATPAATAAQSSSVNEAVAAANKATTAANKAAAAAQAVVDAASAKNNDAVLALAKLRQCQIVYRNDSNIESNVKACILRTLGDGAYATLQNTDLSATKYWSNPGVQMIMNSSTEAKAQKEVGAKALVDIEAGAQETIASFLSAISRNQSLKTAHKSSAKVELLHPLPDVATVHYRIIGGISVAAASATDPNAQFVGDAAVQFPLSARQDLGALTWLWGDLRVGSIAQPGALSSLSSGGISSYVTPSSASPNQIIQSIELHAGVDYRLWMINKEQTPMTLSAVVTGGIVTPLSTSQWTPTFYQATPTNVQSQLIANYGGKIPDLQQQFTAACSQLDSSGKALPCYVAFPPADRTTLYHDFGGGLRMKWYWLDGTKGVYLYPSIVDLIVGRSEYVTGGKLQGAVLHFGGSTPIPQYPQVYIFGSFDTRLDKPSQPSSLLLTTAPTGTTINLTDPTVVPIQVDQPNRDRWQFGIGFDLRTIVDHWKK